MKIKIIFHGYKFIHYAPIYLLENDPELKNFQFLPPDDSNFLNHDYAIQDDAIHIFLVGQDKFYEKNFKKKFTNLITLIDQKPVYLLRSKISENKFFAQYKKGNSFHFLIDAYFKEFQGNLKIKKKNFGLDVFDDDEFKLLNDGKAHSTISWNFWRREDYKNVEVRKKEAVMPITPFGWTCLITKTEELKDEVKLKLLEKLTKKLVANATHIYEIFEHRHFQPRNYKKKQELIINAIKKHVDEKDKSYLGNVIGLLAINKIWIRDPIYCDKKLTDFTDYLLNDAGDKATKSAVAEIINRNYAHHIGSHVSHRATFDKIMLRLGIEESELIDKPMLLQTIIQMENKLSRYKDERNEFISSVTAGTGSHPVMLFSDVILPFIENTLLMDNLAANEGINYGDENGIQNLIRNKLQISCEINGKKVYAEYFLKDEENDGGELVKKFDSNTLPFYRGVEKHDKTFYEQRKIINDDIAIVVPGPLGKHSFFSILENFIRNTSKHGDKEHIGNGDVEIRIKIRDKNDDSYRVTITDNISEITPKKFQELKKALGFKIRDKRRLGLQDMKINAGLLAGLEITEDNCRDKKRALTINRNENGILAYEFDILKAKRVAVFHPVINRKELKNEGIYYFNSLEEFLKIKTKQSYQFAVFHRSVVKDEELFQAALNRLPSRVLMFSPKKEKILENKFERIAPLIDEIIFEIGDANLLLETCWKFWLNRWQKNNEKIGLNIYFEQKQTVSPTDKWLKFEDEFNKKWKGEFTCTTWFLENRVIESKKCFISDMVILYDRHGKLVMQKSKIGLDNLLIKNHYNLIDKNSRDFDRIFTTELNEERPLMPLELIEAGLLRILILDERVQENSINILDDEWQIQMLGFSDKDELRLFDGLWASNILAVTHLKTDKQKEKPLKTKISETENHVLKMSISKNSKAKMEINFRINFSDWNSNITNTSISNRENFEVTLNELKIDAIIIHRTILKDLISEYGEGIITDLNKAFPFFFVTTGGGVVHDVNEPLRIIPFGIIQELLLNNNRIAKYCFTQTLMNLPTNKF